MQYLLNKQEQKACNSISSLELEFIDFQLFNKVLLKAEALKNNWHFNNYLSQKKKKITIRQNNPHLNTTFTFLYYSMGILTKSSPMVYRWLGVSWQILNRMVWEPRAKQYLKR